MALKIHRSSVFFALGFLMLTSAAPAGVVWQQLDTIAPGVTDYDLALADGRIHVAYEKDENSYYTSRAISGGFWIPASPGPLPAGPAADGSDDLSGSLGFAYVGPTGSLMFFDGQSGSQIFLGDMALMGSGPLTASDGCNEFVLFRDNAGQLALVTSVPEPATLVLLALGALSFLRRRG